MYITRKGQYALFFLIDLALHDGSTVTVKQVAKEYDLSEKYMEQVASKLRHAGIGARDSRQQGRLLSSGRNQTMYR